VVELVISHHVDNVWKLETATFEEISVALSSLLSTTQSSSGSNSRLVSGISWLWMVVEILGNHNIATENQNITAIIVRDIDI
jgi:hypothetical protein